MPVGPPEDLRFVGTRLKRKVILALALSAVLPLTVLAYVVHTFVLPNVGASTSVQVFGLQILLVFTVMAMIVGGYVIYDLGRMVARIAEVMSRRDWLRPGGDEAGTLMDSFSRMVTTIEQQAIEINRFATQLDATYKELESTNAKLKETSFKDEVTTLYNRRFFSIRLEEELSRHRRFNHPVSIVLFDLDGFKAVNDELGHAAGDETLRDIAHILMKHSRGINVVARYGGDEFAILLVETSKAGARLYADRIRQVVSQHPFSHGKRITASFGVASLPDDEATTSEDLYRAADDALYAAKRAGKNQVAAAESPQRVI